MSVDLASRRRRPPPLRRARLPRRRGHVDRGVPVAAAGAAAAARGRARRRQDRGRAGAGRGARRTAGPAAVLRGAHARARRSTTGTTSASCSRSGSPSRSTSRSPRPTCSARSTWSSGRSSAACGTTGRTPPVLLIDEIDRADDEFEALLLEVARRGLGDRARARHLHRRAAADRRAHLATAAATCTTRCAAAASTTGWSTPSRRGSCAILRRTAPGGERGPDRVGRAVRRPRARRSTSTSRPAWPRRSTGWPRSSALGATELVREIVVADPRAPSRRPPTTATSWSPALRVD